MGQRNREAAFAAIRSASTPIPPGPALLLVFIADLVADDGGLLEVGCDWMAREWGQPRSSVQRWRAELVDLGILIPVRIVSGGPSGNTYRLNLTAHPRADTNRPPTSGLTAHPRADTHANRPPTGGLTAHQPPTHGREQEQLHSSSSSGDQEVEMDPIEQKVLAAARAETERLQLAGREIANPEGYARKKAASPDFRARVLAGTDDQPPTVRNDPEECAHLPIDSDGYCTACRTQVREAS